MSTSLKTHLIAAALALSASAAHAQTTQIKIRALNGKDGKPLPLQRIVLFGGSSSDGPRFHEVAYETKTGNDGIALVTIDLTKVKWIQAWTDGLTLCQEKPNFNSFKVDSIQSTGLLSPNTCSKLTRPPAAGEFLVFARPATFLEKRNASGG